MKAPHIILCCVTGAAFVLPASAAEPVTLTAPTFEVFQSDGKKNIAYTQASKSRQLDLTATNGFFDRCFQAEGKQAMLPGDDGLIRTSFDHLIAKGQATGTARWHLLFRRQCKIVVSLWLSVPKEDAGHSWTFRLGGQSRTVKAVESDGRSAQPVTLGFSSPSGHQTLAVDCSVKPPAPGTQIRFLRIEMEQPDDVHLMRARWRPAAVHTRFAAPPSCQSPDLWIFETRAISKTSSYSPLTTPFGYYGTSFNNDAKVSKGQSFNFSMWFASRSQTKAPPLPRVPRILATGMPDATFGHFGHEGSGVKLRNSTAYPDGADRLIQALRVGYADNVWTYYGYFYDEKQASWHLFAAGRKPHTKKSRPDLTKGLARSTGSFCEVPGPPQRERSGDRKRIIVRRGWFVDRDGSLHRAQIVSRKHKGDQPLNKYCHYSANYAQDGWMTMATGGVLFQTPQNSVLPANSSTLETKNLPEYLKPEKIAQLHRLPVTFGKPGAHKVTASSAEITCPLSKLGSNAKATLYYGTTDCLTYGPRNLQRNDSAALKDFFRAERVWQHSTPAVAVTEGNATFTLDGLQPDTTYFFRLYVEHDKGKSWAFESGTFATLSSRE